MNFHSDEYIMNRVQEHYNEALESFPKDKIVGIFYQGSGNYGLDYEGSDVDTKLIVSPTFKEIAMNQQPISTTHIRANNEHTDWKDIRLYIQLFKKQNINFIEILFTKYKIINPLYEKEWNRLVNANESIARYSVMQSVSAMCGTAKEKYYALEHRYPSRVEWIDKYGYDPKQLHHLLRIEEFIERYTSGQELYADCLITQQPEHLLQVKIGNAYTLEKTRVIADASMKHIDEMYKECAQKYGKHYNEQISDLLDDVQYNITRIAIEKEIKQC